MLELLPGRILAAFGLMAASPLLLLIAAAIFVEDGAPILFRQIRVGRGGMLFQVVKFRSMKINSSSVLLTSSEDTRITRVGRIIRKYKLDELPQLWNVLRGEMGLIGPRPEVPQYVNQEEPLWQALLRVRPGITDLATLVYRDEERTLSEFQSVEQAYREIILPDKLALNLQYLQRRSTALDIRLLFLTVRYSFWPGGFDPKRIKQALLPESNK